MVELDGLTVRYGDFVAVADLHLALADDEIVTLVGPTGCGKSSVLRAVAGFEVPAEGRIVLGDQVISRTAPLAPEHRGVGLVFQDFALFPHLSVEENVGFRVQDPALVTHWLAQLSLTELRTQRPETLSGGQKQRVALARALAHSPRLVLLDEPLSNLDAALKSDLRWRIREALKSAGVPAIWVTHDQSEALAVGDRVGVMRAGKLEQLAEPEACYRAPATRFVAQFLGDGMLVPGVIKGDVVETEVGVSAFLDRSGRCRDGDTVDVLVRPHDVALSSDESGAATVVSSRYEGETRLCTLRLASGTELRVRVSHEQRPDDGSVVSTAFDAHHALPVFSPSED